MPTVGCYMTREPYSIESSDSLSRARKLMKTHSIRHLPVIDGDKLVGVLSARDIATIDAIPGVDLAHVEVARVMDTPLSLSSQEGIDEASETMATHKRDCLVVNGPHCVVGVFTATDALLALADIARRATT